jgi:hypothetical protein
VAIGKYLKRVLAGIVLLGACIWTVDWLVLSRKIDRDGGFGQVEVRRRYEVHLKNRQIDQRRQQPQMVECVESVFPHYEEEPCWYLKRHANQTEDLDGGAWHFWSDDRP